MHDANSIDVVIPSFRLDEEILLNIFNLPKPESFLVNYYLVADNPIVDIPEKVKQLAIIQKINLIQNEVNLGFSRTRNNGIRLGNGKWLLLLDDDIVPSEGLLLAYADAISKNSNAIGFAGVTNFPDPFNSPTMAMELNGLTGHFKSAKTIDELMWVPTANVMLNRDKMDQDLFNEDLKKGGEDIEFLVRNATLFGERYIAVPDAIVTHPWWNNGTIQTERQFRYGVGAAQIADLPVIKSYTYHDFTNTCETLLLLVLALPYMILNGLFSVFFSLCLIVLISEFLTNCIKTVFKVKKISFGLAVNMFWLKNCYEVGYLFESIKSGRFTGFAERIETSFSKKNPSWFRLNKWKIIKTCLIGIGLLVISV
ncbi:glycosyltransferase [Pedobacter sp. ASV1-7]|uniref:glycosyltransferase family 2 protein n=1 Tax=Pedobacter sp. ASV1-7 TaxID=3145237 RepID=UPI0032E87F40